MSNDLQNELIRTLQQQEHLTKRQKYLTFLGGCTYMGKCIRCDNPVFMDDFGNAYSMNFNTDCDCRDIYGQDEVCNGE